MKFYRWEGSKIQKNVFIFNFKIDYTQIQNADHFSPKT